MYLRICIDCGEEFRPGIPRCSDCGGELEDRWDGEGEPNPPASAHAPEAETRPLALATEARDLVPAADRLRAEGVVFHIAPRQIEGEERPRGFELRVSDADRGPAARVLGSFLGEHSGVTLLEAFPVGEGEPEGGACPACFAPVPAGVAECPGCGLGLGAPDPD